MSLVRPVALCVVLAAGGASAAPPSRPPADDAQALFQRAAALYKAGVYDKAAEAFEQSFAARRDWTTALNLAQALEGAGRPAAARAWYERVRAEDADAVRRARATAGLEYLSAHGFVQIRCAPLDAEVEVGGKAGRCPEWRGYLPAGEAVLRLRAPDRPGLERPVTVIAGERVELGAELALTRVVVQEVPASAPAAAPGPDPQGATARVEPPPASGPDLRPTLGWVALGLGVTGLGVGAWGYLAARDDADRASGAPDLDATRADAKLRDDFEAHRAVAYGGLGAGAALVGLGLALLWWPDSPADVALAPAGSRLVLGGRF